MAKTTTGKDGLLHRQVYIGNDESGKRIYKRLKARTEKQLDALEAQYKKDARRNLRQGREATVTLREAMQAYVSYLETRRTKTSPSTLMLYDGYLRKHFQALMDKDILLITEEDLQEEVYKLEDRLSGKSIANIVNFFLPGIRHFRKDFRPELEMPPVEKPKSTIPDTDSFLAAIDTIRYRRLYVAVVLAAFCGMRRSEVAALDLRRDVEYDVEMQADGETYTVCILHIREALVYGRGYKLYRKGPKTDAGERTLYASSWINDLLKACRDDPKFTMYTPQSISNEFREWAKEQNIGCTYHGLRHYYASIMLAIGVPTEYAMKMMGHSTDQMLRHYQELIESRQNRINKDLIKFLESPSLK